MQNFITRVTRHRRTGRKKAKKTTISKHDNAEDSKEIENTNDNQIEKSMRSRHSSRATERAYPMQGNLL
jgi:hypothetical protein